MTRFIAALCLLPALAACEGPPADEDVTLHVENRATEAVMVSADIQRCLDGVATFDGQTILIEKPGLEGTLFVRRDGECAESWPALSLVLRDLAGGEIGRISVGWNRDRQVYVETMAMKSVNACADIDQTRPDEAVPRISVVFKPCE